MANTSHAGACARARTDTHANTHKRSIFKPPDKQRHARDVEARITTSTPRQQGPAYDTPKIGLDNETTQLATAVGHFPGT